MATALITGGTSGIGAEFARQLAAQGFDLVLVARDVARLERMAAELPVAVEILPADLLDRDQVAKVAKRIEDSDRPIEVVVNNAGFSVHTKLTDPDLTNHDRGFEVMMHAVLVLGGAAGRAMAKRGRGRIINVSSTAGFVAIGSYSAMKAWVISYSESLAVELRGTGVNVTVLAPGYVHTEFHERGNVSTSKIPGPLWIEAEPTVRAALRDSERGKVVSIPSIRYKVLIWFVRHAPKSAVRAVSGKLASGRGIPADGTAPAQHDGRTESRA
jgi:short-subunit dehydrogenase